MPEKAAIICAAKARRDAFQSELKRIHPSYEVTSFSSIKSFVEMENMFDYVYIEKEPCWRSEQQIKTKMRFINGYDRYARICPFSKLQIDTATLKEWRDLYDSVYGSVLSKV